MREVCSARQRFDRQARDYDLSYLRPQTIFHEEKLRRLAMLLQIIRNRRPTSVLDIGCGSGFVLERVKAEIPEARLVGVDFSAGMLQYASTSKHLRACVLRADAAQQPFRDEEFDCIYALGLIDYLAKPLDFFREVRRLLRANGIVVFTHPNAGSFPRAVRAMLRRWLFPHMLTNAAQARHIKDIEAALTSAGLEPLERRYLTYGNGILNPPWSIKVSRIAEHWTPRAFRDRLAWTVFWVVGRADS